MNTKDPHDIIDILPGKKPPKGYVRIPDEDAERVHAMSVEERSKYLDEMTRRRKKFGDGHDDKRIRRAQERRARRTR